MFIIKNFDKLLTNTTVHGVHNTTIRQLHRPLVTLSSIQKVSYSGIKIFNRLPPHILELKNETPRFRVALKMHHITHVYYSGDEF